MSDSPAYQLALEEVASYETTVGFKKPELGLPGGDQSRIIIQQNNVIIQLLVNLHKRVGALENQVQIIKGAKNKRIEGSPVEEDDLSKIISKLDNLSLGPTDQRTPQKKGIFYAFKDPYKIFEEEKNKGSKPSSSS
jgi:hypothetical protein